MSNRSTQRRRPKVMRILQLVEMIRLGLAGHNYQIAQELGVSRRTVARDLALLRNANLPVIFDEERNCYRMLSPDLLQAERQLSTSEIEALILAVASCSLPVESSEARLACTAMTKLAAGVSVSNGLLASRRIPHLVHPPALEQRHQNSPWEIIVTACREQSSVRLQVQHRDRVVTTKVSQPRLIFQAQWHVEGRSSFHKSRKRFPVSEILHADLVTPDDDSVSDG